MAGTQVGRLDPEEVRRRRADGESILAIDVRTADARRLNPQEIPGSQWISLAGVVAQAGRLPRDATLLTYCT